MDITILAVSKRLNGVCIAGVGKYNAWIRPAKKEELMLEDIKIGSGYVSALNIYEFHFSQRSPVQCQSENYLIDEQREIIYRSGLEEKYKGRFFSSLCENSLVTASPQTNIADILKAKNRSLMLIGPIRLQGAYFHKEEKMKAPELTFSLDGCQVHGIGGKINLLCTDLKFNMFAKSLLNQRNADSINLDEVELKALLGYNRVYVVIGLTKLYHGINWPMVIGIHTLPDYRQVIDYKDI
jgi:hypothetical protein